MKKILLLSSALMLAACASTPPQVADLTEMPGSYDHAASVPGAEVEQEWWRAFGDPDLDTLIAEALAANQDLAAGVARVRQARASLSSATASLLPSISGGASASSNSENGFDDFSTSGRLSASYQLDIFGETRANRRASKASYDAQQFDQRGLELTVQSDVAFTYFSIIAQRERLDVAKSNLEISERIYNIIEKRYEAGDVSGFDVASQQAALANARARIPQIEQQLVSLETALAVLLGRIPQQYHAPEGNLLAAVPPAIDVGLPSDLLLRRPDLLGAEASLRAANANVDAARAAFFPSIDLSSGLSAAPLTGGTSVIGSFAASLAQPVFNGGRLIAGLEGAKAGLDQQIARYRQATLNALRDVEVSLAALSTAEQREAQLQIAKDASEQSLSLAETRYNAGADDLTSLLNAQSTFFNASDSLVQGRLDRLTAATDLYVALGGGWSEATPPQ